MKPVANLDGLPVLPDHLASKYAEIRRSVVPRPPTWTFFSGVFSRFPGAATTPSAGPYAYMTAGLSALILIGLILEFPRDRNNAAVTVGFVLIFLIVPIAVILGTLSVSYTAACCLCVLESTSAGQDHVNGWPDADWKDWAGTPRVFVVDRRCAAGLFVRARDHRQRVERATSLDGPLSVFPALPGFSLMSALDAEFDLGPNHPPGAQEPGPLVVVPGCCSMLSAASSYLGSRRLRSAVCQSSPHSFLICPGVAWCQAF